MSGVQSSSDVGPSLDDVEVAIAHWHVRSWGGAEYLVTKLAEVLDVDRVYTTGAPSLDDPNPYGDVGFYDVVQDLSVPRLRRLQSRFGRAFEYALWEDVDWRDYGSPDVLLTSGATTRAVITPDHTFHVNYCHSPPRWFYDLYHDRKQSLTGMLARPFLRYLRMRDASVDARVDSYFANSPVVARRISKYYQRDAEVLYPPVEVDSYRNDGDEGFYLYLGRLDEEKGVSAIVEAFAGSDHSLVLAGGRGDVDEAVLETIRTNDSLDYRGFVSEEEKRDLLASCRAVVFNGRNEDFGIVPIEANASGKAVLARDEGFPGMFVEDGKNGILHDGTVASIEDAVRRFEQTGTRDDLRQQVETFSLSAFESRIETALAREYDQFQSAFGVDHNA